VSDSSRTPPTLIASITIIILAVGVGAYYFGRFGRASPSHPPASEQELPEPAAPAPDADQPGTTPVDIPPTVTPPIPVVVEKGGSSSVRVERSSQIVAPVATAPPPPTPVLGTMPVAPTAAPRRRIIVQVQPTPTPTASQLETQAPPEALPTPVPPPEPEDTPEPEPTESPRG
jgi:hypothetical protein